MAYTPTNWKDRVVEKPRTYRMQDNGDGTITLIPEPGTIYELGTPVNAANLNKLENGLQAAAAVADSAMPKSGGQFTGHVKTAASAGNIGDSGSTGTKFEVVSGSANDDAFMTFHVPNNFAFKFGIDRATKRLAVGGWSLGTNKYKLWDERDLRVNDGVLEFFDGGAWKPVGFDPRSMTLNMINGSSEINLSAGTSMDIFVVDGSGILTELQWVFEVSTGSPRALHMNVVADGVEKPLNFNSGGEAFRPSFYGWQSVSSSSGETKIQFTNLQFKFNSSLILRVKNLSAGSVRATVFFNGGYYS